MIIPHKLDKDKHLYTSPGQYVLSTSDIIELNGLKDVSSIPIKDLRYATYRGAVVHKAVENYEQGREWQDLATNAFMNYIEGWFSFRDDFDIEIVGPHEHDCVYLHDCGQAIGCTIDLRFLHRGYLYIGDLKTEGKKSGEEDPRPQFNYHLYKAARLAWRAQTQSYVDATVCDEDFMRSVDCKGVRRAIIRLHPGFKKGYAFHEFLEDDSMLWDGFVRVAQAKNAAGFTLSQRQVDFPEGWVKAAL